MKKLVALGTAYVIGQIIAGLEVGIAISSINRKKGASVDEQYKSYSDLMKALQYPSLFKEIKTFIKEQHAE